MSFIAADSGNFSILEPSVYPARCVSVIYLGIQKNDFDESQKPKPRLAFEFEIIGKSRDDGMPLLMYKEFSMSLHMNSSLRPFLEKWRGRPFTEAELQGFDVSKTLGAPCQLITGTKVSAKGERATIDGILATKQADVPAARSMLLKFDADAPDSSTLQKLPEFVQAKIAKAIKPAPVPAKKPEPDPDDFDAWDDGLRADESHIDEIDRLLDLAAA